MKELVRFGVAMEGDLLAELDQLAAARGCTRSELLRDLARTEVARASSQKRVPAVAAVTLVYNHHVRQLAERLTNIQHGLGESVRSTMHVHLDSDHCIEVIVLRGRADKLREAAEQMLATRGVSHGSVEVISEKALGAGRSHRRSEQVNEHEHAHAHGKGHVTHARSRRRKRVP
jgi:CopG family nickel-responsive transcriptional regulator